MKRLTKIIIVAFGLFLLISVAFGAGMAFGGSGLLGLWIFLYQLLEYRLGALLVAEG